MNSGSNLFFRVYGQRFDHNETVFTGGRDATNAWNLTQGGFRADWIPEGPGTLTLQGDMYTGTFDQAPPGDTEVDGQNILGRWRHTFSDTAELALEWYVDRTWRNVPNVFAEDLKTYDLDLQHRFGFGERHLVTWGAGYRLMDDEVRNGAGISFLPGNRTLHLISGFVQDEIILLPDRLRLLLGTKVEHNDYSGVEVSPSARLAWTPGPRHTVWSAVSRAVRSPSRIDSDLFLPAAAPGGPDVVGTDAFKAESVLAVELGYRLRPVDRLTLSLATYYNFYDDIRSVEPVATNLFVIQNRNGAETFGIELSGRYRATDFWTVRGGYTYLNKRVFRTDGGFDINDGRAEGNDPEHQVLVQSMLDLPRGFQFDVSARYVDGLPSPEVPSYFTFDARLAWWPKTNLEVSVVGQNLWNQRHSEFGSPGARHEIPRSVFGKVSWWF
jgi:iron complex outermembrane receptor protein